MPVRRDRVAMVVDAPRRWPRRLLIGLLAFLVLFYVGGGWYFSGLIRSDALLVEEYPPDYDHVVAGTTAATITFALPGDPPADLLSSEVLGVRWEGGYGVTGAVVSRSDDTVAKQFMLIHGAAPSAGSLVALEGRAVPPDPADAGISYEAVDYDAPFGTFDAWRTPGDAGTWAIFVHGRGATRHEGIRMLAPFTERGMPMLLIQYRNDPGAPATDDHLATFGADEWEDLEAAVAYALDHGAADIVLVGASMGGAIAMSFLYHSDLAGDVAGVVLDAPALELGAMVDHGASDTTLIPGLPFTVPVTLTATAKWAASLRFGADWGAMDYLDHRLDRLDTPVLVFHGTADDTVPIALSREMADRRPGLVELVEVRGAGHVRSWNVDPDGYEAALGAFLDRIAP
ncbi:MAG: lysophospholipase [Actinobacteria bacterium]|nr:lysophospholipase [Actinomycetota bacterium]